MRIPKNVQMQSDSEFYPGLVSSDRQELVRKDENVWFLVRNIWASSVGGLQVGSVVVITPADGKDFLSYVMMVNCYGMPVLTINRGTSEMALINTGQEALSGTAGAMIAKSRNPKYLMSKFRTWRNSLSFTKSEADTSLEYFLRRGIGRASNQEEGRMLEMHGALAPDKVFESPPYEVCQALAKVYSGETTHDKLPLDVQELVRRFIESARKTDAAFNAHKKNMEDMFIKDKWFMGVYRHGVLVGEVDQEGKTEADSGRQPRMYRSINDIPDDIKPSILSGLALYNLTCTVPRDTDSGCKNTDPDNLIGRVEAHSTQGGWIAWCRGHNAAQWIIFDKD